MPNEELIEYGTRKIARRPKSCSEEVANAVFDYIKEELKDALGCSAEQIERDRANLIHAALCYPNDGYKMARFFDDHCGWDCDRNIVEILDDAPWQSVHREFVMQWLSYWKLEPLFNVGDKVTYSLNGDFFTSIIEEVTKIGWIPASYTTVPQSGESGRHIVPWENCKAVEA